jgi:hypothetical protein
MIQKILLPFDDFLQHVVYGRAAVFNAFDQIQAGAYFLPDKFLISWSSNSRKAFL